MALVLHMEDARVYEMSIEKVRAGKKRAFRAYQVALVWLFAISPTVARAQPGLVYEEEDSRELAFVLEPSPLRVTSERIHFACDGRPPDVACTFEGHYVLSNPTDAPAQTNGRLYGILRAAASVDGRNAHRPGGGFEVAVPAHGTAELVVSGPTRPSMYWSSMPGEATTGSVTRHPAMAALTLLENGDQFSELRYSTTTSRNYDGAAPIEVSIACDDALDIEVGGASDVVEGSQYDRAFFTGSVSPNNHTIDVRLHWTEGEVFAGGPFVGMGVRLDEEGTRIRAGWEIGVPHEFVHSLAIESDFEDRVTFVLATEATTPFGIPYPILAFLPSFAAGIGVPVQLRGDQDPQIGVRFSLAFSYPCVTVFIPFDWYPGAAMGSYQSALLVQLSL